LIGGLAVAFIKEGMEDRIHTTEDIRNWTGFSSVIVVPEIERPAKLQMQKALPAVQPFNTLDSRGCLLLNTPNSPELEAINALRTLILLAQPEAKHRIFLVTSPLPGDGKTTMATNLALSLSKLGRTCLIDADLRRPRVAKAFQLIPGPGLADLLRGSASLEEVLQQVRSTERLSVISSWTPSSDAAELVSADSMANLLVQLRSMFDYVVLDTPPVLPYAESRDLSAMVDGIILVGRAAVTPRAAMGRTTELLNEINSAPVLSVVLNGADLGSDYSYLYANY
jgi:capsular exopolysaccharide synthesis family protein